MPVSPALLTDLYELTMAAAFVGEGMADRPATFSLFVRDLPGSRGYLVAGGVEQVLDHLQAFRFTDEDLAAVGGLGLFDRTFVDYLRDLRFTGTVRAVPEGRIVFAGEPLLEVDAPLGLAQILETFALNQVTTQTTLSTKAARHRHAAAGRAVVDFALRRTQGTDAGDKLARAVAITGLAGTSNVAAGVTHGVPVSGTMAHSYIQAHPDETDAFRAFARRYRDRTILLVDTYDTLAGTERAITVARELREEGTELRGIRLDSGDLAELSRRARRMLDEAGFPGLRIFASGGLDEYEIDRLVGEAQAPIDGFGVGSALGVSSDAPVLDSVYKLVEYDGRPVRKRSAGKATWPGRKQVWRRQPGEPDVLGLADEADEHGEPLLVEVLRAGTRTDAGRGGLARANERFEQDWAWLPEGHKALRQPTTHEPQPSVALRALTAEVDATEAREPGTDRDGGAGQRGTPRP